MRGALTGLFADGGVAALFGGTSGAGALEAADAGEASPSRPPALPGSADAGIALPPPPPPPPTQAPRRHRASLDVDELDLEQLLDTHIESVSRHEEVTALAPASVFVVPGEEIRRHGFRTLAEVLRSVPGLFIYDDTLYPLAGVRGMGALGDLTTRLLVMIDGHPLNNSVGIGQSYVARDLPVEMEAVDRVEVIKGPVGSIYGPVAYLGVVNVVTLDPGDVASADLVAGGELAEGAANAGDLAGATRGSAGGFSWSLFAGLRRGAGFTWSLPELVGQDRPAPEGGIVRGADWRWSQDAYAKLDYGDFQLTGAWGQRAKGLPTAPYSTVLGDPRNQFINRTGYLQLTWDRRLTDQVELFARAAYDDFGYHDDLAYPEPPVDHGMFFDRGEDRWGTGEIRAIATPFAGHRDTLGVEVQTHGTLQLSKYYGLPTALQDPVNGFGIGDIARTFSTLNAYLLVEQSLLGERLLLHGGLTFYAHQLFGWRFTPKLAAVYRLTGDDTVKALYTEGFRPPTMFEAFFDDGLDFKSNPALKPEFTREFELGYERRFGTIASVGVVAYGARYDKLIRSTVVPVVPNPNPDDPADYRNEFLNSSSSIQAGGLDLYFMAQYRNIQAYGGIAAQWARFPDQSTAANFPPVTANLALSSNSIWKPLWISLNASFVAGRAKDLSTVVLPGDRISVPPYLLVNASAQLEAPWVRGLAAELTLYNLLGTGVVDPVPGDHAPLSEVRFSDRVLRLEMEYRF